MKNVHLVEAGLSDEQADVPYRLNASSLGESLFSQEGSDESNIMLLRTNVGDQLLGAMRVNTVDFDKGRRRGLRTQSVDRPAPHHNPDHPISLFESHPEKDRTEVERMIDLLRSYGYNYIYSYERRRLVKGGPMVKLLYRVFCGATPELRPVAQLLPLPYLMLIASPTRLV